MTSHAHEFLIFDGVCHLCTCSVAFLAARERTHTIRFATLQSTAGQALLRRFAPTSEAQASIVFIQGGQAYLRSDAIVKLAQHLRMPWRVLAWLRIIPRPLRDAAYDFVARHRYGWFGKSERCMVPSPELKSRFLDEG